MVQEGGKKRNRNRNKNKNKAGAQDAAPAAAQEEVKAPPPAEPEPVAAPPKPVAEPEPRVNGSAGEKSAAERREELVRNLASEFRGEGANYFELREAEKKYAAMLQAQQQNGGESKVSLDDDGGHSNRRQHGKGKGKKVNQEGGQVPAASTGGKSNLAAEIARARQHIKNSLECVDGLAALAGGNNPELEKKVKKLESENQALRKVTDDLKSLVLKLESRVTSLESGKPTSAPAKAAAAEDDDDVDLFGSGSDEEEEDEEKVRIREERLKAYAEKKAKKPALIAKTSVLLDVKPWDDETDMDAMLKACKSIEKEGLVWGASKLVPVGYGINKLQVMCVVEDEKVSIDELCEQISEFEDFVQSVDISAMSKI